MKEEISIIQFLKQWFYLRRKSIQLSLAIRLCDLKQQAFNRRYFVILDHNDKLISLSKEDINRMKRMRMIQKNVTHLDLMEKAFYYTPLSRNDSCALSLEERKKRRETYMKYIRSKKHITI